ncbi:MAG: hypothetical protein JW759_07750 [Candidatus Coatesbacteria bacterium]|nr:hypothetical protein [Candidatus Coatesbacteria bacterium]
MSNPEIQNEPRPTPAVRMRREAADLDSSLDELRWISSKLTGRGLLIVGMTGLNIILFPVIALISLFFHGLLFLPPALVLALFLASAVLIIATYFERLRRIGDVLFLEISDELQWNIRATEMRAGESAASERPKLDVRIALRSFARASDLPLIPGKFGPAIYVAINILIAAMVPWFYPGRF